VGAALLFSQIRISDIGYGCICIIGGLIIRLAAVVIVSQWPKDYFTIKERAFMALAWVPKATV
jgi:NhaP-type Na+/H+ or K+/H+ antiporter